MMIRQGTAVAVMQATMKTIAVAGCLFSAAVLAQPGQGRGMYNIDPRADERSYYFEDAGMDMTYCVYASTKIDAARPAPLIIALHGAGTGPQIMCDKAVVDQAEERGYIVAAPMGYNERGGYGAPRRAGRGGGNGAEEPANVPELSEQDVFNVYNMMLEEFNVDRDRVYLMGHSMGAGGTMYLGPKHAEIWAAIAPIAGGGRADQAENLQRLKDNGVALIVVHGESDEIVPVQGSRDLSAQAESMGLDVKYVELPGVGHGPVINQAQPYVFDFFDAHTK
jgi:predicted peptidase